MVADNIVALCQLGLLLFDEVLGMRFGLESLGFGLFELLKMHQGFTILALCRITIVLESLDLLLTSCCLLPEVVNVSEGN